MKKILVPVFALIISLFVLWKWTLGFSAFTVFSYTLNAAGDVPRAFPDIVMENQDGEAFHLGSKHKYILLNFVYLDCPYVCHKVNNQLEHIYFMFDSTEVPSMLEFVTVSFDLQNDNVEKIKKYRSYFGTEITGWTFALPYQTTQKSFDNFLRDAGIWKYTVSATGITNHSTYLFLIAPDNRIIKVFDPFRDSNQSIVQQINQCIKEHAI